MVSANVKKIIQALQHSLPSQPVVRAWLFGSCSRGEERPDSDVDLLVQYADSDSMSLMSIGRVRKALEISTGRRIDLVEDGCLLPYAAATADNDKMLIYEIS